MAIWHNVHGQWEELALQKELTARSPMSAGRVSTRNKYYRYTFAGSLELPVQGKHAAFTIKFRIDRSAPWQWVNDQFGTRDGELVFSDREPVRPAVPDIRAHLGLFVGNLNPALDLEYRVSQSPGATLWSVAGRVGPAQDGRSAVEQISLGCPTDFVRNFSLVRIWAPWLAPRHGADTFRLTEDAALVSFLRKDGTHLVLLAMSGLDNVLTTFKSAGTDEVAISVRNDNFHASKFQVLVALAPAFDVANAAVMYEVRKIVKDANSSGLHSLSEDGSGTAAFSHLQSSNPATAQDDARAQAFFHWYDELGYCTWNALGQDLAEGKIFDALDKLQANGINIGSLIIDDNWQSLDNKGQSQFNRGWTRFEANSDGFPNGLQHAVDTIRRRNPGIKHIAVWHALMGYWGGISPDGEIAKKYKTKPVKKVDAVAGGMMTAVDPDDIYRFYDDLYSFLQSTGIDSVKTDAQFFLDLLDDPVDRARFTQAYQDAWSISSLRYFQEKAISCMSLTPQIIFHSQVPTNRPKFVLRNSDDFFPDIPSSHPWHVFCNAHVSLLTRYLNVVPDWDMFQTSHPFASFHAAARCVSGGPIYITDVPGQHDLDLISQMTAPTIDGKTVILRPSTLGRTMDIYHNYSEGHILKVSAYNGWAQTGSGILALFNINPGEASTLVPLADFPGIAAAADGHHEYLVRAHSTGGITEPASPADQGSLVSVFLEPKGWEILTAIPVQSFTVPGSTRPIRVGVLGLLDKMTGVTAVVDSDIGMLEHGPGQRLRMNVGLKALGTLGIYISDLDRKSVENNFMVMLSGSVVPMHTVQKRVVGEGSSVAVRDVLTVDVLQAWKEMALDSGWSNEVTVQVFMM